MMDAFWQWLLGLGSTPPPPVSNEITSHKHLQQSVNFVNTSTTTYLATPQSLKMEAVAPTETLNKVLVDTSEDEVKVAAAKSKVLDKQTIIASGIAVEAGYVDHPDDKGGETNFGITKSVAEENKSWLVKDFKWNGDMRDLTYDMAYAIYERKYWNYLNLDAISKHSILLADKMFDIGINCGANKCGRWFQQILNVFNMKQKLYVDIKVDGAIGNNTLIALNGLIKARGERATYKVLLRSLMAKQTNHYLDISENREENESFTWGWVNQRMDHHTDLYRDLLK